LADAVVVWFQGETKTMLVILLSLGAIVVVVLQLHARRQIQQARAKGLWPQLGEPPTLAYPAHWGCSGVMTFIVNHEDKIYEKNLGTRTGRLAPRMAATDSTTRTRNTQATRQYLLLQRNLVYMGITRSKKLVVSRAIMRCPDRDWMILQMQ
jgi:hypothetical protein